MDRVWVPAAGLEKYEVSNDGFIRNRKPRSDRPEVLRGSTDKNGYIRHYLYSNGVGFNRISHRVIWESFFGPIPKGMQVNHKNGIKSDNRLDNLEVVTPSQNVQHSFRVLKRKRVRNSIPGEQNGRAKLTDTSVQAIRRLIAKGHDLRSIAATYGVSQASISFIKNGITWKHVT